MSVASINQLFNWVQKVYTISMEMYHWCFEKADKWFCRVCLNSIFFSKKIVQKSEKKSFAYLHMLVWGKNAHTKHSTHVLEIPSVCPRSAIFHVKLHSISRAKNWYVFLNQMKVNNCCKLKGFCRVFPSRFHSMVNGDRFNSFIHSFVCLLRLICNVTERRMDMEKNGQTVSKFNL